MTREALVALGDAAAEAGWWFWSGTFGNHLKTVEEAGGKAPRGRREQGHDFNPVDRVIDRVGRDKAHWPAHSEELAGSVCHIAVRNGRRNVRRNVPRSRLLRRDHYLRSTAFVIGHATSLQPSRPGAPEVLRAHASDGSHEVNIVQASHLVAAGGAGCGQGEEVSVLQPRGYPLVEDVGRVQYQVRQRRRCVRRRLGSIHRALARSFAAYRHLSRPGECAAPFVRRDGNVFSDALTNRAFLGHPDAFSSLSVNALGDDPYRARAPASRARWDASPAALASTIPPTHRALSHRTRTRARRPPPRFARGRRPLRPIDAAARAI